MLWLFLSVIQKRKTGASNQGGKAEGKKHKRFYSKGIPVISHFKRNSILGYIHTVFILVWEE